MTVSLPYHFDSSAVVRVILRGVGALLVLAILPALLYVLLGRRDGVTALQLLLIAVLVAWFGRLFYKHLEGSRGVITADAIDLEPTSLYGIRLTGPVGRFAIEQFEAVRVEPTSVPFDVQGTGGELVRLVGKHGTPNVLIARTEPNAGKILGRELAAAVGLRYEEAKTGY